MRCVVAKYRRQKQDNASGFTLIEVLVSIVILALFSTVLVAVVHGFVAAAQLDRQRQNALLIANGWSAKIASLGAQNFLNTTTFPVTDVENGTTFTVTVRHIANPPAWAMNLFDLQIQVAWRAQQSAVPASVTLTQVFQP